MSEIILTGFMGTGKTTVGQLVAERLGLQFVDIDAEVVRRAGRSVPEIFESGGESAFRDLEAEVFAAAAGRNRVIATGGGTLLQERNVDLLPGSAQVICLTAPLDEIKRRLAGASDRPLLAEVDNLWRERAPAYARWAQVDTAGRSPHTVAADIAHRAMEAPTATLHMGAHASDVYFGRGVSETIGRIVAGRTCLVVTDRNVLEAGHADHVCSLLRSSGGAAGLHVVPPGEETKSLPTLEQLYAAALDAALDRDCVIVAVGGGVIGDLAGMLAATYLRGLTLLSVPTTLLAQVDAAIGGKVGIDFGGGKNLVGAFHPARAVLIDPDLLATLPAPEVSNGLAEVVKVAAIRSCALLDRLETLARPGDVLGATDVLRSAMLEKVRVVETDPYERGERALLNFGHTVGHAVEAASEYTLPHGGAISVGMHAETRLAEGRGWCRPGVGARVDGLTERFGLPQRAEVPADRVQMFIGMDKKRQGACVRMAIPVEAGRGTVRDVSPEDVAVAVRYAVAS